MVSLKQIKEAFGDLEYTGGDSLEEHIEEAISQLRIVKKEMESVSVSGRNNIEIIHGCMIAIDSLIGQEEEEIEDG